MPPARFSGLGASLLLLSAVSSCAGPALEPDWYGARTRERISILIKQLESKEYDVSYAAHDELVKIGWPALVELKRSANRSDRRLALRAWAVMREIRTSPEIEKHAVAIYRWFAESDGWTEAKYEALGKRLTPTQLEKPKYLDLSKPKGESYEPADEADALFFEHYDLWLIGKKLLK